MSSELPDLASRAGESLLPLAALFDTHVETAQSIPELVTDLLYPEERAYVAHAVPKRQAEFGTARLCARRALSRLGVSAGPLLPASDRSPTWPVGIVGSISHSDGYCAVAVARSTDVQGIGLDIERDTPLDVELEAWICTPQERGVIANHPKGCRGRLGKLFFSAKEAFYKCQYATTHEFLDFLELELELDLENGQFSVRHIDREGPAWTTLRSTRGRWFRGRGFIVTTATLRASLSSS